MKPEFKIRRSIRYWLLFFISALIVSGITAFALETELAWLNHLLRNSHGPVSFWIDKVYIALKETNQQFPFLTYGYDWLGFAHLVIAVAFLGVLKDPVRNKWVVQFGRIACCMIFPMALIAGSIRGIPFFWQLIDCSFGMVGLIPLSYCYHEIEQLEELAKRPIFIK